jgi:hypothetical protein
MREQWYLCRVPEFDTIVMYPERDYRYRRHHEASLRVQDPSYNAELLAQGNKEEIFAYYKLLTGYTPRSLTNVS